MRFLYLLLSLIILGASYWQTTCDNLSHGDTTQELSVQNQMEELFLNSFPESGTTGDAVALLESISDQHGFGMTLGDQKGSIIELAVTKLVENSKNDNVITFLEFGSHIGDGSLRILNQLGKAVTQNCILFSFESNPEWLTIGTNIVDHVLRVDSGNCSYVPLSLSEDMTEVIRYLQEHFGVTSISGMMMDHVHADFLKDLQLLERFGLVHDGTLIIADNALRFKSAMESFIEYVESKSSSFELVEVDDPYPDQVLVAVYRGTRLHDEGGL